MPFFAFLRGDKSMKIESLARIADGLNVKIRDLFPE